jgi:hypothetical protein
MTNEEIKADFDRLTPAELRECEAGAKRMIDQLVSTDASIGKCLRETNGTVSWETIATEVAGGANRVQPACKTSIATYVMSTYGAKYTSTKTQPTMNDANKKQRLDWSKHFFLFYEGAKLFSPKSQILMLHLDEKWFYCLVPRHSVTQQMGALIRCQSKLSQSASQKLSREDTVHCSCYILTS